MLQFFVFRLIEAKEKRLLLLRRIDRLIGLLKHFQPPHLVVKIAAVETHVEYRLVEVLQLLDGKLLRQQFKPDGFKVNLLTQRLLRLAKNLVVVERQLRHFVERKPAGIGCIIADDMRLTAAANIDRGIGKAAPQEGLSELGQETAPAQAEKPRMTDFKPYVGRKRRSGTGCVTEINDHLFEGRYSPKWPDGKKHSVAVNAHLAQQ